MSSLLYSSPCVAEWHTPPTLSSFGLFTCEFYYYSTFCPSYFPLLNPFICFFFHPSPLLVLPHLLPQPMLLLILHWFSLYIALCPAASESVLLQQLFQSKLTQTGSLVPAAQGRIGLRGTKAALMLQRMPSTSSVNATCMPQQPRRYHDLTKVMLFIVWSSSLQFLIPTSTHTKVSYRFYGSRF